MFPMAGWTNGKQKEITDSADQQMIFPVDLYLVEDVPVNSIQLRFKSIKFHPINPSENELNPSNRPPFTGI